MKPPQCAGCPLDTLGQGFVPPSGTGRNGILLLGEAPGAREAALSQPFVGDAGAQLNRTLQRSRFAREDFRIDNACKCRPPNNWLEGAPWQDGALAHCAQYLDAEIGRMKPKVIVAMGNVALGRTLNRSGIAKLRGYVYDAYFGDHRCHVIPTYHPSFLMRGAQNLTPVQMWDLQRAERTAKAGYAEPPSRYLLDPSPLNFAGFVDEARVAAANGGWLAADIETPSSGGAEEDEYGDIIDAEIIRISFSFQSGWACSIPFTNYHFTQIARLFALPWAATVFWNADFDVPRLQSKGLVVGRVVDAMWMWHFLQSDLPRGLGFVSTFYSELTEWKSLSDAFPEFYSCRDADATIQCAGGIRAALEREGRFDSFLRHYVDLQPRVNYMGRSGVLLDPARQADFRAEITRELERINHEIQAAVPRELRPFKPRRKVPPEAGLGLACRPAGAEVWGYDPDTGEWGEVGPFLANSPKQVAAYIRHQGWAVPRHYKTHKDTTGADEIEALAKKHPNDPLFPLVLKGRELRKITGQYIDGYVAGPDGRVRTTFTRKPSTWRFASERPNVQNVLKRGDLAAAYRRQFIGAPGHLLVELDYKAVEAVLTGFYAGDSNYIRAARLGIHGILQSIVSGRPINLMAPDVEIKHIVHELKAADPMLYDACKHCTHLSNYGGSPRRMRIMYPELFKTVKAAQDLQDTYFQTIARGVRLWQTRTLQQAYEKHYLETVYHYRHWFFDVYHYVGRQLEWGTDAKRALAFLPQATASGLMSEAILALPEEVMPYVRWTIHDSLLCEIPDDRDFDRRVSLIRCAMEAPQPLLGGLGVQTEISVGPSWGEMAEYRMEDEVDARPPAAAHVLG